MPQKFYPVLDDGTQPLLQSMFLQMLDDPTYLEGAPYSAELKATLQKFVTAVPRDAANIFEGVPDKMVVVEEQIEKLISDLNVFGDALSTKDNSEKLAFFKTKASLIEKLISMKERVHNLKAMSEFQTVVLGFLDEICTKDQISDLMKRLEK
jgi:uncharacterized protein YaaR (DUF327 family)